MDDPVADRPTETGTGRRYLLGAGGVVTLFIGLTGYVLGLNSPMASAQLFGVLTVPVTPVSLAAYGLLLGGTLLTALFGLVALASRLEG